MIANYYFNMSIIKGAGLRKNIPKRLYNIFFFNKMSLKILVLSGATPGHNQCFICFIPQADVFKLFRQKINTRVCITCRVKVKPVGCGETILELFGLVSLLNVISNFVGYLMPRTSLLKNSRDNILNYS